MRTVGEVQTKTNKWTVRRSGKSVFKERKLWCAQACYRPDEDLSDFGAYPRFRFCTKTLKFIDFKHTRSTTLSNMPTGNEIPPTGDPKSPG